MSQINLASEFNRPDVDDLFLETANKTYYYHHLYNYQSGLNTYLENQKFQAGDKLLLVSELSAPCVFTIAACWNLDIPFIPISPSQLKQSINKIQSLNPSHAFVPPGYESYVPCKVTAFADQFIEKMMEDSNARHTTPSFRESVDSEQIFGIFHSSGTGGAPKQIPLKKRQLYYAAHASAEDLKPQPNYSWLLCLPPYHIGGAAVILRSLCYGNGIHLLPHFEATRAGKLLSGRSSVQAASMVPTMLRRLLAQDDFKVHQTFQGILLGGGPLDASLIKEANERQIPVVSSFGMTETCAQITSNRIDGTADAPFESVGKVFPPNKVQIRSEEGKVLRHEDTGIIWLRGKQVFDGYMSSRDNRRHFDQNGWYNTGDYGRIDTDGNLYVEMRRTDLIVTGGKNVNPHEVEAVLRSWKRIDEVAVVGKANKEWGEAITAIIVSRSGYPSPSIEEVKQYMKNKIESYKMPKQIISRASLPKTSVGKIQRSMLKRELEQADGNE